MDRLDDDIAEIERLLEARLGVKGADLGDRLRRAGRLLPLARRRDGRILAEAAMNRGHPDLGRMKDARIVGRAAERLISHLRGIDPAERRRTALIGRLAGLGFNLIVVFILLVAVLRWRGFV